MKIITNIKIRNIKEKIFILASLSLYMVITFILMMNHENWIDEAQSFMISKNLSFIDIFKQLKYEGHPFVYYFILHIVTRFGFSYKIVNIISWLVMSAVAFLILSKSPFNKLTKVLILATIPFIYQYPVFGRSYCFAALFVILLACLYNKKHEHPYLYAVLISLLMNTHIIMFGFTIMLAITFYGYELIFNRKKLSSFQKKKYIISLIIIGVSILLIVLQFFSTLSLNTYTSHDGRVFDLNSRLNTVLDVVLYHYTYVVCNNFEVAILMTILIMVSIGLIMSFRDIKHTIIFLGAIGYQLLFFFLIGEIKNYILMTGFVIYIFYLWIVLGNKANNLEKRILKVIISMICIISFLGGNYNIVYSDYYYENWGAETFSKFIEYGTKNESIFLCVDDIKGGGIIPYLDDNYRFYSFAKEDYYKFISWDENRDINITNEEYSQRIAKYINENKNLDNLYIILHEDINAYEFMDKNSWKYIFSSAESYSGDKYYLYKFTN